MRVAARCAAGRAYRAARCANMLQGCRSPRRLCGALSCARHESGDRISSDNARPRKLVAPGGGGEPRSSKLLRPAPTIMALPRSSPRRAPESIFDSTRLSIIYCLSRSGRSVPKRMPVNRSNAALNAAASSRNAKRRRSPNGKTTNFLNRSDDATNRSYRDSKDQSRSRPPFPIMVAGPIPGVPECYRSYANRDDNKSIFQTIYAYAFA